MDSILQTQERVMAQTARAAKLGLRQPPDDCSRFHEVIERLEDWQRVLKTDEKAYGLCHYCPPAEQCQLEEDNEGFLIAQCGRVCARIACDQKEHVTHKDDTAEDMAKKERASTVVNTERRDMHQIRSNELTFDDPESLRRVNLRFNQCSVWFKFMREKHPGALFLTEDEIDRALRTLRAVCVQWGEDGCREQSDTGSPVFWASLMALEVISMRPHGFAMPTEELRSLATLEGLHKWLHNFRGLAVKSDECDEAHTSAHGSIWKIQRQFVENVKTRYARFDELGFDLDARDAKIASFDTLLKRTKLWGADENGKGYRGLCTAVRKGMRPTLLPSHGKRALEPSSPKPLKKIRVGVNKWSSPTRITTRVVNAVSPESTQSSQSSILPSDEDEDFGSNAPGSSEMHAAAAPAAAITAEEVASEDDEVAIDNATTTTTITTTTDNSDCDSELGEEDIEFRDLDITEESAFVAALQQELSGLRDEATSSEPGNTESELLTYPPSAFANLTEAQIRASGNFARSGRAFLSEVESAKLRAWKRAQKKLARCDYRDDAMSASKLAREARAPVVSNDDIEHLHLDITDEERFLETLQTEFSSFGHQDSAADAPTNVEMTHARTGKPINYPPSQFAYLSEERIRASRNFELHGFKFLQQVKEAKLRAWKRAQAKLARNNAKEEVKAVARAAREASRNARLEREAGVRQRKADREAKKLMDELGRECKRNTATTNRGKGERIATSGDSMLTQTISFAPTNIELGEGIQRLNERAEAASALRERCQRCAYSRLLQPDTVRSSGGFVCSDAGFVCWKKARNTGKSRK